jgi:hypothetical protein
MIGRRWVGKKFLLFNLPLVQSVLTQKRSEVVFRNTIEEKKQSKSLSENSICTRIAD